MSTFKFKTINTNRKGNTYGEVVEFTSEEKVPVAIQLALTEYPLFKNKYLAAAKQVTVDGIKVASLGKPLKGKWANNTYDARGKLTVVKRDIHKDMMCKQADLAYRIGFQDTLSTNGLPELVITHFEMN